ncbi:TPA: hypothetical protein IU311_003106 [Enterococcus faecalis]|uniref:Uncharacterized protein n=1 Tax=Enterococcus faecalis TaxID=1351 RepID=A0ABD7XSC3_ENTFL|nr:hypothetical protein [Enterococcus faecalis]MBU5496203.1 hypothetical protein [Enterococcus sp. S171_ASV_20]MBU5517726.1 hypothetical protein [Enterococcus sp. S163_ASV_20]MBU5526455.1 hypothetical protein [Enterococcus sp. S159_ASV_20]MBU5560357.1 hypothetical protein [Enterococcus sp. S115_ASV_20]MBU5569540.1 hypothetical protein [Enterococcus sp. S123_ASV_20]MBU5576261.1 hypothetical protein [Enterococcus sp. S131_ASV_20]
MNDYDDPFSTEGYDSSRLLAEKYDSLEEYMSLPDSVVQIIPNHKGENPVIYQIFEGSINEEKLGYILVNEGLIIVPEQLRNYINCEDVGREHVLNMNGDFAEEYFI